MEIGLGAKNPGGATSVRSGPGADSRRSPPAPVRPHTVRASALSGGVRRLTGPGLEGRPDAARPRLHDPRRARGTATASTAFPTASTPEEILEGPHDAVARPGHRATSTAADSTNRVALGLAREGAAHGTTVVAEGADRRARPPRTFVLLAAVPEPLHLHRAAPPPHDRSKRRPGSSPPQSRSRTRLPRPSTTRWPQPRSNGRTTCCYPASRPPES